MRPWDIYGASKAAAVSSSWSCWPGTVLIPLGPWLEETYRSAADQLIMPSKTSKSHMQCESRGFGACHRSGAEGHLPPDLPVFHQVLSSISDGFMGPNWWLHNWGFSPRSWRWQQLATEPRSACCRRACDLSWGKAMTKKGCSAL